MNSGSGTSPRRRFNEKADKAGFSEALPMRHSDLTSYTRLTLALVWPEKAYAFEQVMVGERQVATVAADLGVSVRQIHRYLAGHKDDLGAEDWFLIVLELFREADCVRSNGADALVNCFLAARSVEPVLGPFHRSFFLLLCEAMAGGSIAEIADSLPWRHPQAEPVLSWPCYRAEAPGLVAAIQRPNNNIDKRRISLLASLLAADEISGAWRQLLPILNAGGARSVAENGGIPDHFVSAAEGSAKLMLSSQSLPVQYGLLGVLSCTSLSWEALCAFADEPYLRSVPEADRLNQCAQRYIQALQPVTTNRAN